MKNLVTIFFVSLSLFGCSKRDLDLSKQEAKLSVSFHWSKLPSWDTPSDSMKLYFYGEDGRVFIKNATSAGFTGTIPPQKYNVIAVNTDTKGLEYRNLDNYLNACAVSKTSQVQSVQNRMGSYIGQPERVYGASMGEISILKGQNHNLVLTPEEYSKKANIKFVFSGDVNSVQSCAAEISGLSRGYKLHSGELLSGEEDNASLIIDNINVSDFELSAFFFGVAPNINDSKLSLNFTFSNGYTKDLHLDTSDAFKNVEIAIKLTVYIDVFREAEGGFSARITSWVVTNDNVILK